MRFSLIVSTLGRTAELGRLFSSLEAQTYRDFELILVDQNRDERVRPIFDPYAERFSAVRVHSAKGALRGRNVGIENARGDVIAFPDDDCWYPPTLLETVANLLNDHPEWDGVTGRHAESSRWSNRPVRINRINVWKRAIEWTMFQRRSVVEKVGCFDETLGPGAQTPWGAGEGTDYLIRAVDEGFHYQYEPSIEVHHEIHHFPFKEAGTVVPLRDGTGAGASSARLSQLVRQLSLYQAPDRRSVVAAHRRVEGSTQPVGRRVWHPLWLCRAQPFWMGRTRPNPTLREAQLQAKLGESLNYCPDWYSGMPAIAR